MCHIVLIEFILVHNKWGAHFTNILVSHHMTLKNDHQSILVIVGSSRAHNYVSMQVVHCVRRPHAEKHV